MNHKEINEQERQLILAVIWTLRRQLQELMGLQEVSARLGHTERVKGQQDGIDLLEMAIERATSITDAEILRTIENSQEGLPPALLSCGVPKGKLS